MSERLILVTEFGKLACFDRVRVKPCRWHTPARETGHDYVLLKLVTVDDGVKDNASSQPDYLVGWELLPRPRCHFSTNVRVLTPDAVAERRVFWIREADEQSAGRATARPLEKADAR